MFYSFTRWMYFLKQCYRYFLGLRPKQWIKNLVIFIPLLFEGGVLDIHLVMKSVGFFFLFSLLVGITYHFNDYKDKENDRLHPVKSQRPLVSGKLHPTFMLILSGILCIGLLYVLYFFYTPLVLVFTFVYLLNTLLYSVWAKNKVIIDVFFIAIWFVLRICIAYLIIGTDISLRLALMVFVGSLWFTFLKRYKEVKLGLNTREVMLSYNAPFLQQVVSIMTGLFLILYVMYTYQFTSPWFVCVTFLLLSLCVLKIMYSVFFDNNYSDGIEEMIIHDKTFLVALVIVLISLVAQYFIPWLLIY